MSSQSASFTSASTSTTPTVSFPDQDQSKGSILVLNKREQLKKKSLNFDAIMFQKQGLGSKPFFFWRGEKSLNASANVVDWLENFTGSLTNSFPTTGKVEILHWEYPSINYEADTSERWLSRRSWNAWTYTYILRRRNLLHTETLL